jgi:hypothetical protein
MRAELQWGVPPKTTTDALIRLRQAEELEAMRSLNRAREGVERATKGREAALAAVVGLKQRLHALSTASARTTAGTLAQREVYRTQLRKQLDAANLRLQKSERGVAEALRVRDTAQKALEQALRAREAAEAQREATETAESRRRERRDQAASDDRWRPPRR